MLLLNRTLLRLSKGLWGWIVSITACRFLILIGTAGLSAVISSYLGDMLSPSMSLSQAGRALLSAFGISVLLFLLELGRGELEYRTTAKARLSLRRTIFSKIMELDAGHIEEIGPSRAITAAVDGVESMQSYYSQYLPALLYSFLAPVYLFFQFRKASLPVAVFLLAVSLSLFPINNIFRDRIERLRGKYWTSLEDLTQYYLESIRGLTTFRLFERDADRSRILKEKALVFTGRILGFMKINFTSLLLTSALMYGATLAAVIMAGLELAAGRMSLTNALFILMLSYSFFSSIKELLNATHSALAGVAAAGRVEEIMQMDTSRPYHPDLPVRAGAAPGIELAGVSHAYDNEADPARQPQQSAQGELPRPARAHRPAVQNISLTCLQGQVTALAGPSGCGKSTLAGLMMRFFDPTEGRLFLNGRDYESFTPGELRRHLVMVPQSVMIFSGTLRDNLLLAREDASEDELWEVLTEVRLADWARTRPEGLDYPVGDAGSRLSGGQKQKIGIARALLCQAEYIILDEATSSIDRESEEEIWTCIGSLARTRTLIIISHRLSTIRHADQIYVLDRGRLIESGRHEALMQSDGLYASLVHEQERLESAIRDGR